MRASVGKGLLEKIHDEGARLCFFRVAEDDKAVRTMRIDIQFMPDSRFFQLPGEVERDFLFDDGVLPRRE